LETPPYVRKKIFIPNVPLRLSTLRADFGRLADEADVDPARRVSRSAAHLDDLVADGAARATSPAGATG
jgi:hypothetical protein